MATSKNKQLWWCKHQSPWSHNRKHGVTGMIPDAWVCFEQLPLSSRLHRASAWEWPQEPVCSRRSVLKTSQMWNKTNNGDIKLFWRSWKQNSKIRFFVYHDIICTRRELPYSRLSWHIIDALLPGDWPTTLAILVKIYQIGHLGDATKLKGGGISVSLSYFSWTAFYLPEQDSPFTK